MGMKCEMKCFTLFAWRRWQTHKSSCTIEICRWLMCVRECERAKSDCVCEIAVIFRDKRRTHCFRMSEQIEWRDIVNDANELIWFIFNLVRHLIQIRFPAYLNRQSEFLFAARKCLSIIAFGRNRSETSDRGTTEMFAFEFLLAYFYYRSLKRAIK